MPVMLGGLFAGTEEAPGEVELLPGPLATRATAAWARSVRCSRARRDRYFQDVEHGDCDKLVPEGIEGRVPYKGTVVAIIHQLVGGLRAAMGYCGCARPSPRCAARARSCEITSAGVREVARARRARSPRKRPNYSRAS
jgi:IMP dehydrogenase